MNKRLQEKRIEEIANFIVNNITLAETTTMVVERAKEASRYIVENDIDPKDMESFVLRQKLYKKLKRQNPPENQLEKGPMREGIFKRVWKAITNEEEKAEIKEIEEEVKIKEEKKYREYREGFTTKRK